MSPTLVLRMYSISAILFSALFSTSSTSGEATHNRLPEDNILINVFKVNPHTEGFPLSFVGLTEAAGAD